MRTIPALTGWSNGGTGSQQRRFIVVVNPFDPSHPLGHEDGSYPAVDNLTHAYRHLVGSLKLFLQLSSRLDISFKFNAVQVMLSQFCSAHLPRHYTVAHHVLRHLKGTGSFRLHYGERKSELLKGLSDANWAGDKSGGCVSISGFVWSYGGPISWSAKKQNSFLPPLPRFSPISAVFVRFSSLTFPRSPVLPRFRNLKMRRSLLGCEDLFIYSRQTPSQKPCAHSFYYICIIQCRPRHHHFLVTIF